MRYARLFLCLLVGAATGAVAATASASPVTYDVVLSGASESPPVASPGTGSGTVTLDPDNKTMRLVTNFSGLAGTVTAAHIHCCTGVAFTGTAGVATQTPSFTGFPLGGTSGSYDHTFNMLDESSWNPAYIAANGGTAGTAFTAFLEDAAEGTSYLNIHSSIWPGGEIRGFLTPTSVPLPAAAWLLISGLGALGVAARRRPAQAPAA